MKKFFLYFSLAFTIAFSLMLVYEFFPKIPSTIDNRLRDSLFVLRGEMENSGNVVIVDIDEKSIKKLGQWPWSRNKLAKILTNLDNSEVGIIGFDIVFAEEDRTSPMNIFKQFDVKKENLPDYDYEFAKVVASTPTILGYQFELEDKEFINKDFPNTTGNYIERNKTQNSTEYLTKAKGTILNIPILQENAYSSGFFNNLPDESGIIRSVPLIISYDGFTYPSLALEVLRVATGTEDVFVDYDEDGVASISMNGYTIPTDRSGRMYVNFRGKEKNFKYISAYDIYKNNFNKEDIEGKIVLVGTSAAGLLDLRATPFDFVYPGVEVHANLIDNVLMEDYIYKIADVDTLNVLIIFSLAILTILLIAYLPYWTIPFTVSILLAITVYGVYYVLFEKGPILNLFFPILTIVISSIAVTLFDYFYKIKQEKQIKKKFASKVSKEVMDTLLKDINSDEFQAMEKEVTVFFSDVREFTKISENMGSAKELISYLNDYMEPMSEIITKYKGTIDKYIGDAIMAYWNAPASVKDHADQAVQASLAQIKALDPLNKRLQEENKPEVKIGIGLNTGIAVVGEMGSSGRSDYTVIGDAINLGARLESLCKYYDSQINISNFTKEQLKNTYILRFLDLVKVKGKDKPVEIWQVIDEGLANEELQKELNSYNEAIKLYQNEKFKEALELFEKLEENEKKTNQNIYKIYISRCKQYLKTPPINFDGVYEHQTKA